MVNFEFPVPGQEKRVKEAVKLNRSQPVWCRWCEAKVRASNRERGSCDRCEDAYGGKKPRLLLAEPGVEVEEETEEELEEESVLHHPNPPKGQNTTGPTFKNGKHYYWTPGFRPARVLSGLSFGEAAERSGITVNQARAYSRRAHRASEETIGRLAKTFNVSPEFLIGMEGEEPWTKND